MNTIRAAFPWFGGKGSPKIQKFILENIPSHTAYIEPFGGGASILLNKEFSPIEVYNDVNRGIVNFFRVISDVDYFGKFMARVALLPVSRELYEECLRSWPAIHDPVEQAIRWYYIAQQSFGGIFGVGWGTSVTKLSGGMSMQTHRWRTSFENLPKIHDRLQKVQIECADWRDVLKRFSGPGWLAYCDPPYVGGTRKAGGYEHELHDGDHSELIATLLKYDGAVLLSGYRNSIYAPLLKAGWDCVEIETTCSAAPHTKASGLIGKGSIRAQQRRIECLWRNPEAQHRLAETSANNASISRPITPSTGTISPNHREEI